MKQLLSLSILIIVLFTVSCKSSKRSISKQIYTEKDVKNALASHNIDYSWFTAKGKINLQSKDGSMGGKINLRIKRDSAIWMQIKKLNFEVARVLVTPKDFTIIYRLEHVYEQESLETLKESYDTNLSFTELQDYIIGNIPDLQNEEIEFRQNEKEIICQTTMHQMKSFVRLDPSNLRLNQFEVYNQNNDSVKANYGDYEKVEEKTVSSKRSFAISSLEHGNMKVSLSLSNIAIDKPASMKFSIPAHYEKLKYYRPF